MGKRWDAFVPPPAVWDECLRVLTPGGHLLAFAGSRTLDLMGLSVRLAGFEIRDQIAWLYSQGFPKSTNVSEAMQRYAAGDRLPAGGINPDIFTVTRFLREARDRAGWSNKQIDALFGTNGMAGHWTSLGQQPAVPSPRQWSVLKERLGFGDEIDDLAERLGSTERPEDWGTRAPGEKFLEGLLADPDAVGSTSWGTALKPSFEPMVVGRKPGRGSTAQTVQAYGTGGLNIEGGRIPWGPEGDLSAARKSAGYSEAAKFALGGAVAAESAAGFSGEVEGSDSTSGRWPTNVALDPGVARELGEAGRAFPVFHYEPKAPPHERPRVGGVEHPTVKPLNLMRWLVRLVTPPGGIVLDPFAGSGTTVAATVAEGFTGWGIEREADYLPLILHRLGRPIQQSLFDGFDL